MTVKIGDKVREKGSPEIGEVTRMSSRGALVYFGSSSARIIPYELLECVTESKPLPNGWRKVEGTIDVDVWRYKDLNHIVIVQPSKDAEGWVAMQGKPGSEGMYISTAVVPREIAIKQALDWITMDWMDKYIAEEYRTKEPQEPQITATLLSTVTPGMKSIKIQFPQEIEDTLIKQIERALGIEVKHTKYGK